MKFKAKLGLSKIEISGDIVNPGDFFGRCWIISIEGGYDPLFLCVESTSAEDAIDELGESDEFGRNIRVEDEFLGDYPEESRYYDGEGHVLDLDHIGIYDEYQYSDLVYIVPIVGDKTIELTPKEYEEYQNECYYHYWSNNKGNQS